MTTFLENLIFSLLVIVGFGLAGGFAIIPFHRQYRFAILMSPLAGILLVTLGALSFYSVLKMPMLKAGIIVGVLCMLATIVALLIERHSLDFRFSSFVVLMLIIILTVETLLTTATSIQMNGDAILYSMDGADHLTYANMADWLNTHLPPYPVGIPRSDPQFPYESMPNLLFSGDPRFGSFGFLALVSLIFGKSGAFSYPIACNLTLVASTLALSAMFSKTRLSFVLLTIGLVTCHWFDWSYGGYFAKINGYPSIFFVAGLFCTAVNQKLNNLKITILLLLTAGTTIMFSGQATALFLLLLGGHVLIIMTFVPKSEFCQEKVQNLIDWGLTLFMMIVFAALSSGTIARPLSPAFPDYKLTWDYILPRLAELETHGVATWGRLLVTGLSPENLQIASYFTLIIWIFFAIVAFQRRNAVSFSLLLSPMLLLIALVSLNATGIAYQMIGAFYPLALCGAVNLTENSFFKKSVTPPILFASNLLVIGLIIVVLVMRQPRFLGMVDRYCLKPPVTHQFSMAQIDNIASLVGKETLDIDISKALPQFYYFPLIEFGRRDIALQWLPDTWKLLVPYRTWKPPTYLDSGTFRLTMINDDIDPAYTLVYQTNQYQLLKKTLEKNYDFDRKPNLESFRNSKGLEPIEGPYRHLDLPFKVRWGVAAPITTEFEIDMPSSGKGKLMITGRASQNNQTLTVKMDNKTISEHQFHDNTQFKIIEIPLTATPGSHKIVFSYKNWQPPSPNELRPFAAILFQRLQFVPIES